MWQFYSHHRKVLFQVIKTLDLQSTTRDQTLVDAMNFLIAHESDKGKYVEATLDLSFTSQKWLRTVSTQHKGRDCYIRRHLETCIFSYIAAPTLMWV